MHKFLHEISLFYKFLNLLTVLNIIFFLSYITRSNILNFFFSLYVFFPPSLPPFFRFDSFIKCGEYQKQCKGLNIRAFLILPIQRVPRYALLLKEIIKQINVTDNNQNQNQNQSDNDNKSKLTRALDLILNVADSINSSITNQEKQNKVLSLQIAFGVTLADPARKFIREGSLVKVCRNGEKSKLYSDIFNYNLDIMIY